MNSRCARCGAPYPVEPRPACPLCGTPYAPAAAQPMGYGPPPMQAVQPPMGIPAPARPNASNTNLILGIAGGGCFLVVLVGVILVGVMMLGAASASRSSSPGGPSPASNETTRRAAEIPAGSSVHSLMEGNGGGFSLVSTPPVRQLGTELTEGLVNAAGGMYSGPGATRLIQFWLSYGDEAVARGKIDATHTLVLPTVGAGNIIHGELLNGQGRSIGQFLVIKETLSPSSPAPAAHPCYGFSLCQHVYWSNGRYLSFVSAPPPHARAFFEAGRH